MAQSPLCKSISQTVLASLTAEARADTEASSGEYAGAGSHCRCNRRYCSRLREGGYGRDGTITSAVATAIKAMLPQLEASITAENERMSKEIRHKSPSLTQVPWRQRRHHQSPSLMQVMWRQRRHHPSPSLTQVPWRPLPRRTPTSRPPGQASVQRCQSRRQTYAPHVKIGTRLTLTQRAKMRGLGATLVGDGSTRTDAPTRTTHARSVECKANHPCSLFSHNLQCTINNENEIMLSVSFYSSSVICSPASQPYRKPYMYTDMNILIQLS